MNIDTCNAYQSSLTFPIDIGQNLPSGITGYDDPSIPELYGLAQAVTGINLEPIAYRMNATMDSALNKQYYLRYEYGRVRDACAGPDGSLYFIAYDRSSPRIMRVRNALNTGVPSTTFPEIAVFPNPCTDRIRFSTALPPTTTSAVLRNIQGEIVLSQKVEGNSGLLDVGMLPAGVYYLRVGNSVPKMLLKL